MESLLIFFYKKLSKIKTQTKLNRFESENSKNECRLLHSRDGISIFQPIPAGIPLWEYNDRHLWTAEYLTQKYLDGVLYRRAIKRRGFLNAEAYEENFDVGRNNRISYYWFFGETMTHSSRTITKQIDETHLQRNSFIECGLQWILPAAP